MSYEKKFPEILETVLLAHLKSFYLTKGDPKSAWNERDEVYFARGIEKMSSTFTETRSRHAQNYFNDPIFRSGYLAYFLPVNAMKAARLLEKNLPEELPKNLAIADIGAGPLTLSLGLILALIEYLKKFPRKHFRLTIQALEINHFILRDGETILRNFISRAGLARHFEIKIEPLIGSVTALSKKLRPADFVLIGNLLNEFEERPTQLRVAHQLLRHTAKAKQRILFLEPGTKRFSRDLQALRDDLIKEKSLEVLAPCLHQQVCPLNHAAKSHWCHFTSAWEAPQFIKNFDTLLSMKKQYLLYSYLVLAPSVREQHAVPLQNNKDTFIAISDPMKATGRLEVIGCGPAGRIRFIRAHRDEAPINDSFARIRRGALFCIKNFPAPPEFSLEKIESIKKSQSVKIISFPL